VVAEQFLDFALTLDLECPVLRLLYQSPVHIVVAGDQEEALRHLEPRRRLELVEEDERLVVLGLLA